MPDNNNLSDPFYELKNGIFNLTTTLVITSSETLGRKQALTEVSSYLDSISMELKSMAEKEK